MTPQAMGWRQFVGWLQTMRRQTEGPSADPRYKTGEESFAQAAEDPWWQQARAEREQERGF